MTFIETIKNIQFLRGIAIRFRGILYFFIPVMCVGGGGRVIKSNAMGFLFVLR